MEEKLLKQQVAYLEFVNDQLISEMRYVDRVLRLAGFPDGLQTVKDAAQEVLEGEQASDDVTA